MSAPGSFAVIYDVVDDPELYRENGECDREEYYGFFSSPAEARTMFRSLAGNDPTKYQNPKLVQVIGPIEEEVTHA